MPLVSATRLDVAERQDASLTQANQHPRKSFYSPSSVSLEGSCVAWQIYSAGKNPEINHGGADPSCYDQEGKGQPATTLTPPFVLESGLTDGHYGIIINWISWG